MVTQHYFVEFTPPPNAFPRNQENRRVVSDKN